MLKKSIFLFSLAILMSGCYHAKITTDLEPSARVYDQTFASSWIFGLVPPKTVDATEHCDNGVAMVETRLSFVNMLVGNLTLGIYTPMHIKVTCATGGMSLNTEDSSIELAKNSAEEVKQQAYSDAVELSSKTNKPVYIQLK